MQVLVYAVTVWVKPGFEDAFIEATRKNARGARAEPGNVRFDVNRSSAEPNRFLLYEVYVDEAAVQAHKETEHYLQWREAVEEMMEQPRKGERFEAIDHPTQ